MTKKFRENQFFVLILTHEHIWKERLVRLYLYFAIWWNWEIESPKDIVYPGTLSPCLWNSYIESHTSERQILETTWKPQGKLSLFCCCPVAQPCLTLCDPTDGSTPGFPDLPISWSPPKPMSTESVMPSNHLVLCHPHLLLPSIFPNIRVFSDELALCIRWPKYRSFTFSIVLPVNGQGWFPSGLTGFISLQSKGLYRVFSSTTVQKHQFFSTQPSFTVQLSHSYQTTGKTIALTAWIFVTKVMSLLFKMLSRFLITFLPRSKCLLIS